MIYVVKINNKEYEVEVEKGNANLLKTTIVTQNISPESIANPVILETATVSKPTTTIPVLQGAGELIKAPMPGAILDIKVSVGARVKKGDIVMILEAMKMENEIVAYSDGVVAQVLVSKGASVSTGDSLVLIG